MRLPLILAAAMLLGGTGAARADSPPPAPGEEESARASDAMHSYFAGEKRGGWILVAMGIAGMGAGGYLVTRSSPTARGISYPLLGIGLIHVVAGIFVNLSSGRRIDKFDDQIAREPVGFARQEHARIHGVKRQFTVLEIVEGVLIAGGTTVAVIGYRSDRRRMAGVGLGIALEAAVTLVFDIVAARRAATYSERLLDVDRRLGVVMLQAADDSAPIPGLAYTLRF